MKQVYKQRSSHLPGTCGDGPTRLIAALILIALGSVASADEPDEAMRRWLAPQDWQHESVGPAIALGKPGAFDDTHLLGPCAMRDGDGFRLWYIGSGGSVADRVFKLGMATSRDGRTFERHPDNPVLAFADGRRSILTPTLLTDGDGTPIREQGKLRMWFAATDFHDKTGLHTLHESTSDNGLRWSEPSAVELENVYAPTVLKDGARYLLWYTDPSREPWCLRHATSDDGRRWQVAAEPVLEVEQEWESGRLFYPTVRRSGGLFLLWYGSYWRGHSAQTAIGFAASQDGRHWTHSPHNPVLRPVAEHAWESHYTTCQSVLHLPDGSWRIFYASRTKPPFKHKYFAISTATWAGPTK